MTKNHWGWTFALGIAFIVIGLYAVAFETSATLASVIALGALVAIAGVAQVVLAFRTIGAGHVILLFLIGILDIVVGVMLMQHAVAGALFTTLLLAALFVFGGVYRFVAALWLRFPHYGWVAFSGVITFALGVMLWLQWPFSALWFLGFAVGINFIFAGLTWATAAWRLRSVLA